MSCCILERRFCLYLLVRHVLVPASVSLHAVARSKICVLCGYTIVCTVHMHFNACICLEITSGFLIALCVPFAFAGNAMTFFNRFFRSCVKVTSKSINWEM